MGQKAVLTSEQAREIFGLRKTHGYPNLHTASLSLAPKFYVCAKTIRDIWKGRSWLGATYDLWEEEERPSRKALGRPKGKKDSRPRRRRERSTTFDAHGTNMKSESPYLSYVEAPTKCIDYRIAQNHQNCGLLLPSFKSLLDTCFVSNPTQQVFKFDSFDQDAESQYHGPVLPGKAIQDDSIFFFLANNLRIETL